MNWGKNLELTLLNRDTEGHKLTVSEDDVFQGRARHLCESHEMQTFGDVGGGAERSPPPTNKAILGMRGMEKNVDMVNRDGLVIF